MHERSGNAGVGGKGRGNQARKNDEEEERDGKVGCKQFPDSISRESLLYFTTVFHSVAVDRCRQMDFSDR